MKQTFIVITIAVTSLVCGYSYGHNHSTATVIHKYESLDEMVKAQPRTLLQGNLYTVLAAHYGNSDEELAAILLPFTESKLKQLTEKASISSR